MQENTYTYPYSTSCPTVPVVMYRVSPWKWIGTIYHRFKSLETCIFFLLMGKKKSFTGVECSTELQICSVTLKVLLSIMCPLGQRITSRQEDQTQVYIWMRTFDLRCCFIGTFTTVKYVQINNVNRKGLTAVINNTLQRHIVPQWYAFFTCPISHISVVP